MLTPEVIEVPLQRVSGPVFGLLFLLHSKGLGTSSYNFCNHKDSEDLPAITNDFLFHHHIVFLIGGGSGRRKKKTDGGAKAKTLTACLHFSKDRFMSLYKSLTNLNKGKEMKLWHSRVS